MIKTLRITGVAAVAFAGLVLASVLGPVSLIHLDDKNDQRMGKVLSSPGAVERFHELHGDKNATNQDTKPPLVRQAELFKDIIDPKIVVAKQADAAPVAPRPGPGPKITVQPSAQFTLIGTSCSASDPSASFAYIRSANNTFQWVQCGDEVGHLTIKEVREVSLLCWDGTRESEIPMEAVSGRVSLLDTGQVAASPMETPVPQPVDVKVTESPTNRPKLMNRPVPPAVLRSGASKMTDDERAAVNELMDKVKKMQNPSGGDANTATAADKVALANKLIAELRSSRVSPQENRNLENMGDQVTQDSERALEEQKRELLKRLNPQHSPQN